MIMKARVKARCPDPDVDRDFRAVTRGTSPVQRTRVFLTIGRTIVENDGTVRAWQHLKLKSRKGRVASEILTG